MKNRKKRLQIQKLNKLDYSLLVMVTVLIVLVMCMGYIYTGNAKKSQQDLIYDVMEQTAENQKSQFEKYIEEKMKQIESNRIAKAEEVLAFLSASLRGEVLEEVISTKSDGAGGIEPIILKKQLSAKDRIKAAELLGKRYALFTEKVDLEGNVGVTIIDDIGTLEDE